MMARRPEVLAGEAVRLASRLAAFQAEYSTPVRDLSTQAPAEALASLEKAVREAPATYRTYLNEALQCYGHSLYRAAILMVWAATVEHLYQVVGARKGGVTAFEQANKHRFAGTRRYREIRRVGDFLYLGDRDFIQLAEDAGLMNRSLRRVLGERLDLRNLCGHPTQYTPGREETVVFIESLILNVINGSMLNW
jgi:hypothetical protein